MRTRVSGFAVAGLAAGLALGSQSAEAAHGTSIAKMQGDGKVLAVATGTRSGRCSARGDLMVCEDLNRSVRATLGEGCLEASGGARCEILDPSAPPDEADPPTLVDAEGTTTDVQCETGSKKGNVYTISDADGTGQCDADPDAYGNIRGGGCTKHGKTCTSFDCEHGCAGGSAGCECHLKREARDTVRAEN